MVGELLEVLEKVVSLIVGDEDELNDVLLSVEPPKVLVAFVVKDLVELSIEVISVHLKVMRLIDYIFILNNVLDVAKSGKHLQKEIVLGAVLVVAVFAQKDV